MVSVEVPDPFSEDGEKLQFAPLGRPVHDNVTAPLKPLTGVRVTIELAELPGASVAGEGGFAAIRKSGVAGCDTFNTVMMPNPVLFSLTSVTRSMRLFPVKSAARTNRSPTAGKYRPS